MYTFFWPLGSFVFGYSQYTEKRAPSCANWRLGLVSWWNDCGIMDFALILCSVSFEMLISKGYLVCMYDERFELTSRVQAVPLDALG